MGWSPFVVFELILKDICQNDQQTYVAFEWIFLDAYYAIAVILEDIDDIQTKVYTWKSA